MKNIYSNFYQIIRKIVVWIVKSSLIQSCTQAEHGSFMKLGKGSKIFSPFKGMIAENYLQAKLMSSLRSPSAPSAITPSAARSVVAVWGLCMMRGKTQWIAAWR